MTPPLRLAAPRTLFVFEAAARTGSFSAAAREFNVTQPSVSRAIAQLEADLGLRLFDRSPLGIGLTRDGQRLFAAVTEGFGTIGQAIGAAQGRVQGRQRTQVMLSFSSSFATHWLLPRLRDFKAAFPAVELRLDLAQGMLGEVPPAADIATRIIAPGDPRFHAWPLAPEIILPVCAPAYLAERGTLDGDPARHVFLTLDGAHGDHWRRLAGCRPGEAGDWHSFSDYSVALQAAANGEGIALGWVSVVSRALREGGLVRASDAAIRTRRTHSLISPRSRPLRPVIPRICDWLAARMAEDLGVP
ncbi:LysR substrate-binding domain-containing protein [Paracoccus shandongensis]|uniref:LysR substrate-binding domain-containing protein n=1 Tax=Paracoccus shandongensis TaxID=2816048 RepID=UPI001A8ED23F|nr:LysR substrate-binding domain-containing protein [Paracoccus shandongensis]